MRTGRLRTDPLDRIASLLIGLAQYQSARYIEHRTVSDLLAEGAAPIQDGIAAGLAADMRLREMGLAVVSVRIAGVSPSAELARALETPTFERAQGVADEASFARRAQAVEKERAIAENELSTKVELARRQAALIAQEDENARRVAEGRAEAGRIAAEAEAARFRLVEAARNGAEGERLVLLRGVDPAVLQTLTPARVGGEADQDRDPERDPRPHRGARRPAPRPRAGSAQGRPDRTMTGALAPRLVLVTRETEYEGLMARHATRGQAQAFLRQRAQSLTEVDAKRDEVQAMLAEIRAAVPKGWRIASVRRAELDRFLFGPEDVVVAVGQDGLVANLAKYLDGQPVIGVNGDPARNPGVLVPHTATAAAGLLQRAAAGTLATQGRTMVRAEMTARCCWRCAESDRRLMAKLGRTCSVVVTAAKRTVGRLRMLKIYALMTLAVLALPGMARAGRHRGRHRLGDRAGGGAGRAGNAT